MREKSRMLHMFKSAKGNRRPECPRWAHSPTSVWPLLHTNQRFAIVFRWEPHSKDSNRIAQADSDRSCVVSDTPILVHDSGVEDEHDKKCTNEFHHEDLQCHE